jgi:hypothetical protein
MCRLVTRSRVPAPTGWAKEDERERMGTNDLCARPER